MCFIRVSSLLIRLPKGQGNEDTYILSGYTVNLLDFRGISGCYIEETAPWNHLRLRRPEVCRAMYQRNGVGIRRVCRITCRIGLLL